MSIRIERSGKVATVIHSRPEARNAMDPESAIALTEAFQRLDADRETYAIVFWGEGGAFCAGWDLKYAHAFMDRDRFREEIVEGLGFPEGGGPLPRGPMGPSRLDMSKPLIAAVEGPAVAGGMELALWCDIRVMAEDAYFGVYCRRWGIPLIDGGTVRLPRLVGQGRALEIIMTGRKVPAEEALRIGLCEQVTAKGQARAAAEAMAQEIARFPQGAMLADRRSAIAGHGLPVREALAREWAGGVQTSRPRARPAPAVSPPARAAAAISAIFDGKSCRHDTFHAETLAARAARFLACAIQGDARDRRAAQSTATRLMSMSRMSSTAERLRPDRSRARLFDAPARLPILSASRTRSLTEPVGWQTASALRARNGASGENRNSARPHEASRPPPWSGGADLKRKPGAGDKRRIYPRSTGQHAS